MKLRNDISIEGRSHHTGPRATSTFGDVPPDRDTPIEGSIGPAARKAHRRIVHAEGRQQIGPAARRAHATPSELSSRLALCSRAVALVAGSLALLGVAGSAVAQPERPSAPLRTPSNTIEAAPQGDTRETATQGDTLERPPQADTVERAPRTGTTIRRAPWQAPPSSATPAPGHGTSATDGAVTELERARRELAEARRNLEAAARDVARASAQTVGPVVRDLRRQWGGTGQRAMLGVAIMDHEDGAAVSAVSPGGPAAEAGVRVGDVIIAIDGAPVARAGDSPSQIVIRRLSEVEPGTPVELRLRSNGDTRTVRLTTRERAGRVGPWEAPAFQFDGFEGFRDIFRSSDRWSAMELVPLTPQLGEYFGTEQGLLVVRAPDDESLLLADGDVIVAIGGREPSSPEHAMRILASYEPGETLELSIMRQREPQTLRIELPADESERRGRGPRGWPAQ